MENSTQETNNYEGNFVKKAEAVQQIHEYFTSDEEKDFLEFSNNNKDSIENGLNYENSYKVSDRQEISHNFYNDHILNNMKDSEIYFIDKGWSIHKKLDNYNGAHQHIGIATDKFYTGFITNCRLTRGNVNQDSQEKIYYVNIFCNLFVEGFGLYYFKYSVPANITRNSKLTQTLHYLGINLHAVEKICLDDLVGLSVKAKIDLDKNGSLAIKELRKL